MIISHQHGFPESFLQYHRCKFFTPQKWLAQFTEMHPGPQNVLQYPSATSVKANQDIFQVKWVLLWYFSF